MTIFIGADHRGLELKNALLEYLHEKNIRIEDLGAYENDPLDDYPDYAQKVATAVLQNPTDFLGIAICGSGGGVTMATNRYKGIRAGLAINESMAKHLRENDHVNVLTLASDYTKVEDAQRIVDSFLAAKPIMEDKYLRRVRKLDTA